MGFVHMKSFMGRDDCGGAVLVDDGRAKVWVAGAEVFPGVDSRLQFLTVELDRGFE